MSKKMLITLAVLCCAFIISTAASVAYYTSVIRDKNLQISSLEAEVARLESEVNTLNATVQDLKGEVARKNSEIASLNYQISSLRTQIDELNNQTADYIANQPKLVIDNFTAEDDRTSSPYNLHLYGRVNNTGGSTAYNAFLHVLAFNADGVAINAYHSFTGITARMSLGLNFRLNYTGPPITSWSITPIWTDELPVSYDGAFSP